VSTKIVGLRRTFGFLISVLPQSLTLLVAISFSVSTTASTFWILGSFVEESRARTEGARLSQATGIELFLQESIQSGKVRYRLVTGALEGQSDREALKLQLMASGAPFPWAINFEAQSDLETLSAVNLDEGSGAKGGSETEMTAVEFQDQNLPLYGEDDRVADLAFSDALSEAELAEIDAMLASFDGETFDETLSGSGSGSGSVPRSTVDETRRFVGGLGTVSDIKRLSSGTQTYAVAGSFEQAARAIALGARLASQIDGRASVVVVEAKFDASLFHRVLVGPLSVSERMGLLQAVNQLVDQEAWLLSGVAVLGLSDAIEDAAWATTGFKDNEVEVNGETFPVEPVMPLRQWPGEDDPYNAARLNSSVRWPVPKT
jgi:hypothetical protein